VNYGIFRPPENARAPHVAITLSLVRRARDILLGCAGLAVWQGLEWTRARRGAPHLDLEAAGEP